MVYIIVGVFVVAAIVIFPLIRWSWIGNRTVTHLLSGQFDQTPLEQEIGRVVSRDFHYALSNATYLWE